VAVVVSRTLSSQTWECVNVDDRVPSTAILNDDVNAKQVEAKRLLKPDGQTPQFLGVRLKQRQF